MATTFPFPSSPSVGQEITLADGTTILVWTGYSWEPKHSSIVGLPSSGSLSGFRNRIINPSGAVRVRAAITSTHAAYLCDRWVLLTSSAFSTKVSAGADDSSATGEFTNSPYPGDNIYLISNNATVTPGAGDYVLFSQMVPYEQMADFKMGSAYAKPLILSFVGVLKPGMSPFTISVALRNVVASTMSFVQNVTLTTTPQKFVILIPAITSGNFTSTPGGKGLELSFIGACGSTYYTPTPGAWASGVYIGIAGISNISSVLGQYFRIQQVQLEEGTVPTAFEVRPYGTELALCQRYFEIGRAYVRGYFNAGTDTLGSHVRFNTAKRAAPTVAFTPGYMGASGVHAADLTQSGLGGFTMLANVTTAGQDTIVNTEWTADAEVS